jgi:hypothetical protein
MAAISLVSSASKSAYVQARPGNRADAYYVSLTLTHRNYKPPR